MTLFLTFLLLFFSLPLLLFFSLFLVLFKFFFFQFCCSSFPPFDSFFHLFARFRSHHAFVYRCVVKIKLLDAGLLEEASLIDFNTTSKKMTRNDVFMTNTREHITLFELEKIADSKKRVPLNAHTRLLRNEVIAEFWKRFSTLFFLRNIFIHKTQDYKQQRIYCFSFSLVSLDVSLQNVIIVECLHRV